MLCYVMFFCSVLFCSVMLCYVMLCYVMLCYVMLCYVMLCYVMLCYVMLCYVMLCYVMLCYVMYACMYVPIYRHTCVCVCVCEGFDVQEPTSVCGDEYLPFYVVEIWLSTCTGPAKAPLARKLEQLRAGCVTRRARRRPKECLNLYEILKLPVTC